MEILETAARQLESLGVRHAPIERPPSPFYHDDDLMRYVTLEDPSGVYYILGTDNMSGRENGPEERIQLIFLGVPEMAEHFAIQVDFSVEKVEPLPTTAANIQAFSAFIIPRHMAS